MLQTHLNQNKTFNGFQKFMLEHRRRCSVVRHIPSIVVEVIWHFCIHRYVANEHSHYTCTMQAHFIKMQNRNKLYLINCCWNLGVVIRLNESLTGTSAIEQSVRRHRSHWNTGKRCCALHFRNGNGEHTNDINEKNLVHFLFSSCVWLQWNECNFKFKPVAVCSGRFLEHWYRRPPLNTCVCVCVCSVLTAQRRSMATSCLRFIGWKKETTRS